MKKYITLLGVILLGQMAWAQEGGFTSAIGIQDSRASHMKFLIEDLFNSDEIDAVALLTPQFLQVFNGYYIRRANDSARDTTYRRNLSALLSILIEHVGELSHQDEYIEQLRVMLLGARESIILGKAIELYGKLVLANPLNKTQFSKYSAAHLFGVDAASMLKRVSLQQGSDNASYLVRLSIPYLIGAMKADSVLVYDEEYISGMTLLASINRSGVVGELLQNLYYEALLIEAKNIMASKDVSATTTQ